VSIAAHPNGAVTTALLDERHFEMQRRARLNTLRIQERGATRANVYRAQSRRLRTRLTSDAAHGERKRHPGAGKRPSLLGAHWRAIGRLGGARKFQRFPALVPISVPLPCASGCGF
jgi:hypothetical protein